MATNFQGVDDVRDLIARALGWVRRSATALPTRLFPATGRHRKLSAPERRVSAIATTVTSENLCGPSGPYTLWTGEVPGTASVRPYRTAYERSVRRRRRVLWMATMGLDLDTRNIHVQTPGVRARPVLRPGWTVTGGGL